MTGRRAPRAVANNTPVSNRPATVSNQWFELTKVMKKESAKSAKGPNKATARTRI